MQSAMGREGCRHFLCDQKYEMTTNSAISPLVAKMIYGICGYNLSHAFQYMLDCLNNLYTELDHRFCRKISSYKTRDKNRGWDIRVGSGVLAFMPLPLNNCK